MHSKLFVPGSRPELFAKAMAGRRMPHPNQVAHANDVLRPTVEEIAHRC